MAIIKTTSTTTEIAVQGMLPDQFVSEKEKQGDDFIKKTMDYLGTVAHKQVENNSRSFIHNYNLLKGILRTEDFFMKSEPNNQSLVDLLLRDVDLPEHVRHYSILNTPLNTLLGEQSKRPDFVRVKAFDEDSKSEELKYKTDAYQKFVMQEVRERIKMQAATNGEEMSDDDIEKTTMEQLQDDLVNYTSIAERWANHALTLMKTEFNFKELSEEAFRDLLITSREFFAIREDNTKVGFHVETENPQCVWYLTTKDKKYTSDQSGRNKGAYAAGTLKIMELSEIIQTYNLPKEEVDHLRAYINQFPHMGIRPSSFETSATGQNTIKYDVYSPLAIEDRLRSEAGLAGNFSAINDFLGTNASISSFANKFAVVESYHLSKKKVGLLTYLDEQQQEQTMFVDENYQTVPTEVSIEWDWTNQWMKGIKIGHDVYHLEPYELLDYCPIIGVIHEAKNVDEPSSFIDMLKHYQTIYNVCMNQIFKLLEKEFGVVYLSSLRQVPLPKDGDGQDATDIFEQEMKARGVAYVDDSPENMKGGPSGFQNGFKAIDLTRSQEIQTRWQLAIQVKREAWELVGISQARTGSVAATQTAQGTQTEMSQSYAQTEPYFAQHEYLVNQVYQALIDACQYIETQKPESTLSLVTSEGEQAFIRVNTNDIKMRDLKVFVTSRAEDQQMFKEMQQLAQAMLQNGATVYDVSVLYTTNSIRQMKDIFKSLKDKQEQYQQQQQQIEQGQLQQQQQATQMQIQAQAEENDKDRQNENYNKELDRLSKERIAIIGATGFGKVQSEDSDANGIPDVLQASQLVMEHSANQQEASQKQKEFNLKQQELLQKNDLEREKLKVARENMKNDKDIAVIQSKAKAKAASKKPKSK